MSSQRKAPMAPSDLRVLHSDDTLIVSFELPRTKLSPAEADVLVDLLDGRSNAEIAARRGRSARTIANQVAAVLRKLGVSSRIELIALRPVER